MDYSPTNDELLLMHKTACIANPDFQVPREYYAVASEWKSSIAQGIDYELRLDDRHRDLEIFKRIDRTHIQHFSYLNDYYHSREKLISDFGGAIFYLDETLTAYNKFGDSTLLNELKDNGIRIGTNFSKENIGCFVANVAIISPFETFFRIGHENYLHIFSGFACYARYMSRANRGWKSVNLVFIPISALSEAVHNSILFMLEAEDLSAHAEFMYPSISQRIHFLERISLSSNDIFMLLDTQGDVLFTSDLFYREFGKRHGDFDLEPLRNFMPSLVKPLESRSRGGKISFDITQKNAKGQDARYTVFSTEFDGYGYRLCFVPHIPDGIASGGTKTRFSFNSLIGKSESFIYALAMAQKASQSLGNVLITGESGTGKEMVAQAIHAASLRSDAPFVPVNCAAIPKDLINSELLGFEEGAFTGARRGGQAGKFELADGGTIFLDEIAEIPLETQSTLLRVLEDRVVNRLGSSKYHAVNTRIIAATNKNLWECVEDGSFRLDLYYRLNIIRVELPPLRERPGDLDLLIDKLLEKSSYNNRKPVMHMSMDVRRLFHSYSWPGNVRELKNIIERCVIMADSNIINAESLPKDIVRLFTAETASAAQIHPTAVISEISPNSALKDYEKNLITETLAICHGNKSAAAKQLGISRGTLYKRMQEANIGNV